MVTNNQKTLPGRPKDRPCAIDLFSGCGGLTLGLKQAGFEVLSAIEIDPTAVETYKANHKGVLVKHADILKLSAKGLRRELKLRRGELDLLAGCPPCQGFSKLRTQNGAKKNRDTRNSLVHEVLRFTRAFRPKAVMMENVPGLVQHMPFKNSVTDFVDSDIDLNSKLRTPPNTGFPNVGEGSFFSQAATLTFASLHKSRRFRSVRGAIGQMADPGRSRDALHNIPEKRRATRIRKLIRDIPKDGGSRTDLPKNRQLHCHKKCDGFSDIYGRMAWREVAPTITSGCFNPSKGRFLHPDKNRAITMREAALLQGFPRNYIFDLSKGKEAIALMIGNALPPEFIRRHALEIRNALMKANS